MQPACAGADGKDKRQHICQEQKKRCVNERMKTLALDLETFSSADLSKCGVYKYAEAPDFTILLFGYSADGGPVHVIDLACGEKVPDDILSALVDEKVIKSAFNANFERVCLSRFLTDLNIPFEPAPACRPLTPQSPKYLNPVSWHCTMIWSACLGLPMTLAGVGEALKLDRQKMAEGKDLIRYFCVPCSPTRANGGRTRNLPGHAPDRWATFKAYNIRDVEVETSIQAKLRNFPVPDEVWDQYHQDQEINDRGIGLDMTLVKAALQMDAQSKAELTAAMQTLTKLENPNSVLQMKEWLAEQGLEAESLGKKEVAALLRSCSPQLRDVLVLRQQLAKSSVRKYQAMENAACADGRARGMFQFYGANRTGRWSGKLVQLQNLPQNHLPELDAARQLVREGDYEMLRMIYADVPDTLSQLIRTAFIPAAGCKFIVADFSAIEARVIAWLAGEQWRQNVFREGGDIYCASASAMFHVPVVKHGVNGHLRQKGKIAELALGYGGGVGALKAMGALDMGLREEELQPLVRAWREANPNIVRLWWDTDAAAKKAVRGKGTVEAHGIVFACAGSALFLTLPSGRKLTYAMPAVCMNRFGGESIAYRGMGTGRKWEQQETYGPKLVENIVQAISRDILCYAMKTLRDCRIVAHVHDELIIECDPETPVETICEQMGRTPPWTPGLILRADGYETPYYKKD